MFAICKQEQMQDSCLKGHTLSAHRHTSLNYNE